MNPDELAGIVARLPPEEVARFVAQWGEQINYVHAHLAGLHVQSIAEALVTAAAAGSSYGVDLVNDLASEIVEAG
jgi:hypothetical protein